MKRINFKKPIVFLLSFLMMFGMLAVSSPNKVYADLSPMAPNGYDGLGYLLRTYAHVEPQIYGVSNENQLAAIGGLNAWITKKKNAQRQERYYLHIEGYYEIDMNCWYVTPNSHTTDFSSYTSNPSLIGTTGTTNGYWSDPQPIGTTTTNYGNVTIGYGVASYRYIGPDGKISIRYSVNGCNDEVKYYHVDGGKTPLGGGNPMITPIQNGRDVPDNNPSAVQIENTQLSVAIPSHYTDALELYIKQFSYDYEIDDSYGDVNGIVITELMGVNVRIYVYPEIGDEAEPVTCYVNLVEDAYIISTSVSNHASESTAYNVRLNTNAAVEGMYIFRFDYYMPNDNDTHSVNVGVYLNQGPQSQVQSVSIPNNATGLHIGAISSTAHNSNFTTGYTTTGDAHRHNNPGWIKLRDCTFDIKFSESIHESGTADYTDRRCLSIPCYYSANVEGTYKFVYTYTYYDDNGMPRTGTNIRYVDLQSCITPIRKTVVAYCPGNTAMLELTSVTTPNGDTVNYTGAILYQNFDNYPEIMDDIVVSFSPAHHREGARWVLELGIYYTSPDTANYRVILESKVGDTVSTESYNFRANEGTGVYNIGGSQRNTAPIVYDVIPDYVRVVGIMDSQGNVYDYDQYLYIRTDNTQTPDTQTPDTQNPDTQNPDTQTPNTQDPNTQIPDVQSPRNVREFIERLYLVALHRPELPAEFEVDYWYDCITVWNASASETARFFFFNGNEFSDLNLTDEEYVVTLYETFMDRNPYDVDPVTGNNDQAGVDYWMERLSSGASREEVFNGFTVAPEWEGICNDYGVRK